MDIPKYFILIYAFILTAIPCFANPFGMDYYEQKFSIQFKNAESAKKAVIKVLPLYHGYDVALSCRWDDNMLDSLRIRDIMNQYGFRGTFYLTESKGWCAPSETGVKFPYNPIEKLAISLKQGGNSIGGHSLTHEYLTMLCRNRAFREIMGVRVDREVNSQSPILSFAFPFMAFQSETEGSILQQDMTEILKRSGYYHLSTEHFNRSMSSDFLDGIILTYDGTPMDNNFKSQLSMTLPKQDKPLYIIAMHAWIGPWGGKDFPKLRQIYKTWGKRESWWYCNQNQYGAYRYQFLFHKLKTEVKDRVLEVRINRPSLMDLNDDVGLSFCIEGVKPGDVLKIDTKGAVCVSYTNKDFLYSFDLSHNPEYSLPSAFGNADNFNNDQNEESLMTDERIPYLASRLHLDGNNLILNLKNIDKEPLEKIRIVFRMPLRWKDEAKKKYIDLLNSNQFERISLPLTTRDNDFLYTSGKSYYAAQIDFKKGQKHFRFYSTCRVEEQSRDYSYSRNGFIVLGPLPSDREDFDLNKFFQNIIENKDIKNCYPLFEDVSECWQINPKEKTSFLTPDIIFTTGKSASRLFYTWDRSVYYPHGKKLNYLLWGKVISPSTRNVRAMFQRKNIKELYINNVKINSTQFTLQKGENDIKILYYPHPRGPHSGLFDDSFYGAFFRIVDEDGNRAKDIIYKQPEL